MPGNAGARPWGADAAPLVVPHERLHTAVTLRYVQAPLA